MSLSTLNHPLLTTQGTLHFNAGPGSAPHCKCVFSLSVKINNFASNLLPAVFSGVLQTSNLWCHLSYIHWPDYLSLLTNVSHHSLGIQFSWKISQRSLLLNLQCYSIPLKPGRRKWTKNCPSVNSKWPKKNSVSFRANFCNGPIYDRNHFPPNSGNLRSHL